MPTLSCLPEVVEPVVEPPLVSSLDPQAASASVAAVRTAATFIV
jgi:hypothetical protein